MVVIRLARAGSHKRPFYHIVAADSKYSRDGRFIERLGFFHPLAAKNEERIRVTHDRVVYWVEHGAQVSPRVKKLISSSQGTSKKPAVKESISA